MKDKSELWYYIIYHLRKHLPLISIYYFINLFLKAFGLFICTHNIRGIENNNITLHKLISNLFVIPSHNQPIPIYEKLSIAFFILMFFFLIYLMIIFYLCYKRLLNNDLNKQNIIGNFSLKDHYSTKRLKQSLCFITYFLLIISLLNQHIYEILFSAPYSLLLPIGTKDHIRINNPKIISISALGIINIISAILLSFYYILFIIISLRKVQVVNIAYRSYHINFSLLPMLLSVILQAIQSINKFLIEEKRPVINISLCIIVVVFLLLDTWNNFEHLSPNKTIYTKCLDCIKWDCLYSGIIEIILFYSIPNNEKLSQQLSFYKQILEIILIAVTYHIIHHWYTINKIKQMSMNLFLQSESDTKLTIEDLRLYFNFLYNYFQLDSPSNFKAIFEVLQEHIGNCINNKCLCHQISSFNDETAMLSHQSKMEKILKEMILIGEQGITNAIYYSLHEKKHYNISELLYLHIDYIALIKHNKLYSFYLAHNYYDKSKAPRGLQQCSIMNKYYLYETKRFLYKSFITNQKVHPGRLTFERINISSFDSYTSFYSILPLYHYLITMDNLLKCIYFCSHNLEIILSYLSLTNLYKNTNASAQELLKLFTFNIQLNSKLYQTYLNDFYKKKYKNMTLNYILTHYLLIYYGEILQEYIDILDIQMKYNEISKEQEYYDSFFQESNSLIATLNNDDSFTITYASSVFCSKFNKRNDNLINENFNTLLPDSFGISHNIYMKLFILDNNKSFSKSTFIITDNGIMTPISFIAKKIIQLQSGFSIIFIINKKKTHTTTQMQYEILLEKNMNILSVSQSFEKHFYFTKEMFAKLKINFCDFIGLNIQRIQGLFNKMIQSDKKIKQIKIEEINNALTVYTTVANDKVFLYRNFEHYCIMQNVNKDHLTIVKVYKTDFCKSATMILQFAKNFNLENSILERIAALKNRIYHTISSNEGGEEFTITFNLRIIGKLLYYVVTIDEMITKAKLYEVQTNFPSFFFENNPVKDYGYDKKNSTTMSFGMGIESSYSMMQSKHEIKNVLNNFKKKVPFSLQHQYLNYKQQQNLHSFNEGGNKEKTSSFMSSLRFIDSAHHMTNEGLSSNATNQNNITNTNSNVRFINQENLKNYNDNPISLKAFISTDLQNNSIINPNGTYSNSNISSSYNSFTNNNKKHKQSSSRNNNQGKSNSRYINHRNTLFYHFITSTYFKVVIIFLVIIIFILILSEGLFFYFSFSTSSDIFRINYESFVLKADIAFCSLLFVRNCLVKDNINTIEALDFTWKFKLRSESMLNHLNILLEYINKLNSFSSIDVIYQSIYSETSYKILNDDWTESNKNSTIVNEINTIYFFFSTVYYSNEFHSCRIKEYNTPLFIDNQRNPFTEEKFLFYIINNSLVALLDQINHLNQNTLMIFNEYQLQSKQIHLILSIGIAFFSLFFVVLLLMKLFYGKFIIKSLLMDLYINRQEQNDNENGTVSGNDIAKRKLSLFKIAVIEMNKKNCFLFENAVNVSVNPSKTMINKKIKSINNSSYYSMGMEENNSMGLGIGNSMNASTSMNPSVSMNASSSINPIASAHNKGSNINTGTGSHHRHSQINNPNNNNNNSYSNQENPNFNYSNNTQLMISSFENLSHYTKITQLPIINTILIILLSLFLINFIIILSLFLYINTHLNQLEVQNDIGINLIEKIPIFAQLLLYYITSIIQNDAYYITKNQSEYSLSQLNYYNITIDIDSYSIFSDLTNSNYAYLYHNLLFSQTAVMKFMSDDTKKHLFTETLQWSKDFNLRNSFHIYTAIGFVMYYQKCTTALLCLYLTNEYSMANLYVKNDMAANGMDNTFDLMTQELNHLYLNFNAVSNINGERNKISFLTSENFWIIFENSQRAIKAASDIFQVSIHNDMIKTYTDTKDIGLIASTLIIFVNFICMMLCVMLIMVMLERKIDVLVKVGKAITLIKS